MLSFKPLLPAGLTALGFFGIQKLSEKIFPVPESIANIEDEKERRKEQSEYYSSFPSITFGVATTLWSLHSVLNHGTTYGQPNIPAFQGPMIFAYGYFMHEFILAVVGGYADAAFFFHHLSSLVFSGSVVHFGMWGSESVRAMLVCECTGPLYNLTVVCKAYKKEKLRSLIGLFFMALFFYCRSLPLYNILVNFQIHSGMFNLIKIFPTMIWFVSMSWIWDMLNKVTKLIGQSLPNIELAQLPYKIMKKIRKFKTIYLAVIGYISLHHWIMQFVKGGAQVPHAV